MNEASLSPNVRRRLLVASLALAIGMLASSVLSTLEAAWASPVAAAVMAGALLGAGYAMRPAVPVGWAPVAGAGIVALGVIAGAALLLPATDAWSTAIISGGAFFVVLLASPRDETGWQTITSASVVAVALVLAIWM